MSKKRTKQYLLLLMVVGLVSIAAGSAGTFGSFNAEVTNAGNTFATGTLLLSDKVTTGTACYSNEAGTNNNLNAGCSAVLTSSNMSPSHSDNSYLTIKSEGTLNSSDLKIFIPKTQTGAASCANTTTGSFPGSDALAHTGDVCGQLKFSIEEDSSAGNSATATQCLVGTEIGGGNHACDPTQGASFATFYGSNYDSTHAFDTGVSLAPNDQHFYKIYMYLPDENNTFQGRTARFDISWHVDQA
jgi:hypothetical protein